MVSGLWASFFHFDHARPTVSGSASRSGCRLPGPLRTVPILKRAKEPSYILDNLPRILLGECFPGTFLKQTNGLFQEYVIDRALSREQTSIRLLALLDILIAPSMLHYASSRERAAEPALHRNKDR
jgi:hypothetical protein